MFVKFFKRWSQFWFIGPTLLHDGVDWGGALLRLVQAAPTLNVRNHLNDRKKTLKCYWHPIWLQPSSTPIITNDDIKAEGCIHATVNNKPTVVQIMACNPPLIPSSSPALQSSCRRVVIQMKTSPTTWSRNSTRHSHSRTSRNSHTRGHTCRRKYIHSAITTQSIFLKILTIDTP